MNKNKLCRRLLAVVLAITVGATFIPLLGGNVYAEEDIPAVTDFEAEGAEEVSETDAADVLTSEDDEGVVEESDANSADITTDGNEEDNAPADAESAESESAVKSGDVLETTDKVDASVIESLKEKMISDTDDSAVQTMESVYTVSSKKTGNKLMLTAKITDPNYQFSFVILDLDQSKIIDLRKTGYEQGFTDTLDLTTLGTGYHTVSLVVTTVADTATYYADWTKQYVSVNSITAKPNYNGKFYYVYSKYFDYFPFNFGKNQDGNLYMEYKIRGAKKWKRSGAMKANAIELYTSQGYKIKGLKANKTYNTRLRYGQYVTYSKDIGGDGKTYFFGGPVRKTTTIKTGQAKKPVIKSVKVKAVKVKKHKVKHYGYYTGVYLYTEKFYTYKVKVTVNLKKKPGAAGLWINGKFVKGNKKKYTVTLPGSSYSSKKPKGKKFKVNISSYKAKSYGGLSPLYKKTKKIK